MKMASRKKRSDIDPLLRQRCAINSNIERIKELIVKKGKTLTVEELNCRLEILETYFQKALEIQSAIESFDFAASNETDTRDTIENLYCSVKVNIKSLIKEKTSTDNTNTAPICSNPSKLPENLPKIKLPQFSGKYGEFPNFIRLFRQLVHGDPRLSEIEKYNHLISCLTGPALRCVKALDFIDSNYEAALSLLEKRFNNKYLMCQEHIRSLFSLNKVQKGAPEQLRALIDSATAHFNALRSLLSCEELCNSLIVHLTMASVDSETLSKVEEAINCTEAFSFDECLKVLNQRCQILETREVKQTVTDQPQSRAKNNYKGGDKTKHVALASNNKKCSCCNQNIIHPLWKCSKFLELSPIERFEVAKGSSLCINCLSPQHTVRNCKSSNCKQCQAMHHTLLHRNNKNNQQNESSHHHSQSVNPPPQQASQRWHEAPPFKPVEGTQTVSYEPPTTTMVGRHVLNNCEGYETHTILATALIEVASKSGERIMARALLDSASQLNCITQNFAQLLMLEKSKVTTTIGGIGQAQTHAKYAVTASIKSRISNFESSLQFVVLPSITGLQPTVKLNTNNFDFPQNIVLADPQFNNPQKIDLLIGADLFFELFDGNKMQLNENGPVLIHTVFGWIVSGKFKVPKVTHSLVAETAFEPDEELNEMVKLFWSFENVPDAKPKRLKEHEECEDHFANNTKRLQDGRFEVQLPFKHPPSVLGNSQHMAIRRFYNLEKRLLANPKLKQAYVQFLAEYETEGHMNQIPWPTSLNGHYIMPHHCVLRPEKITTKCRVVFDGSAKTDNNISLNDILKVGPTVQNDLITILLNFRTYKYGLMADIKAMYRQINVYPDDCKVQNIIWRNNPTDNLNLYRLNTVTYGTASAPYLATRCLIQLADDNMQTYPAISYIIKEHFYVDDLITGGSSLSEIQTIKNDVSKIMAQGCFKLHKWFSNHRELIPSDTDDVQERLIKLNDANVVKTLGVLWDANFDVFKFKYNFKIDNTNSITKRKVLSDMSKLFDPMGLIKPITVKAKIFMQELWLKNLSWDEAIPQEFSNAWIHFLKQLDHINKLQIPRYVLLDNSKIELHGFGDASTRAYGCCFYIRCVDAHGNTKINLLTSRSKVAPISTVRSLPCLELCGAHLMTKLFQNVRNLIKFNEVVFWSDSTIVLSWLKEHATNFNTFVANRVAFIQENTSDLHWRYVPSSSNPADLISRGTTVEELSHSIWFSGPEFLKSSSELWPQHPKENNMNNLPERKAMKSVLLSTKTDLFEFINSRSHFSKTCKIVSYIRRFVKNCRDNTAREGSTSLVITSEELDEAFTNIIFVIQHCYYGKELAELKKDKQVSQSSSLKALNPFIERNSGIDLLKVGGRLKKSNLPYIAQCPIILPKNCSFVTAYIRHLHIINCHAGPQALLNLLYQQFWVIGAREYARKVVRQCVLCFKYRPKMLTQIMGDLPSQRVTPAKPFTHCGVDFCGPIVTTVRMRSKPKFKSYIAVFVCFVTRAVHMEVVSALTTEAFLSALKRFVARRGLCTTIYCDNATNFVGARNELKELLHAFCSERFQNDITSWCAIRGIEFKHIPPRSPHFGGIWEAAVKSAKHLLYKMMQAAVFTFEELTTAVTQIEGILNSRPLTAASTDPNDERVLTPAHFLCQSRAECIPEPTIPYNQINLLKTWQQITAIQQHFWNRWSKEYLILLQQRQKWSKSEKNLECGSLVMVHEENSPPQRWTIGRVTKLIAGTDGKVRVADIKTSSGIIRRSITRLAALPIMS